jgi:hypothetical protein
VTDERRSSDGRRNFWLCLLIVAVAGALRFWTLGQNLPCSPQPDEPDVVNRAVAMMTSGSFHPHFFDYPGLVIYLHLLIAIVRYLAGVVSHEWTSLDQVDPMAFYLWSRAATAAIGTLTVLLVYRIGRRRSATCGLFAAGLTAVYVTHVRESHFALTDVPLTFLYAATWLASIRASEVPTLRRFLWAGALAGLATSAKYTGVFALLAPLIVVWTAPRPIKSPRWLLTLAVPAAALAAFLLTSPYTVIDLKGFLNGFGRLAGDYRSGAAPAGIWRVYLKHFWMNTRSAFYYAVLPALAYGVWQLRRRDTRALFLPGLAIPLLIFWFICQQRLVYARYLLPLLPFAAVLTGALADRVLSLLMKLPMGWPARAAAGGALIVALCGVTGVWAAEEDYAHTTIGTPQLACQWIRTNIPRGARVGLEGRAILLPPKEYTSENLTRLPEHELDYYGANFDYLVAVSEGFGPSEAAPAQHPEEYAFYQLLFKRAPLVQQFVPADRLREPEIRILRLVR